MSNVPEWFVIPRSSLLAYVVVILRISPHGHLRVTASALEIESEYINSEVVDVSACQGNYFLLFRNFKARLFPHVEFSPNIEEVTTSVASH